MWGEVGGAGEVLEGEEGVGGFGRVEVELVAEGVAVRGLGVGFECEGGDDSEGGGGTADGLREDYVSGGEEGLNERRLTQKRSWCCVEEVVTIVPFASTTLAETMLSRVRPHILDANPNPPYATPRIR